MKHRSTERKLISPANIARAIVALGILGGVLLSYNINPSEASQPPGGDSTEHIYVDNVLGSDETGDGSITKPFATIGKGNFRANASGAPEVILHVKGNRTPYQLTTDMYPKRNNMQFLAWDGRPKVVGYKDTGYGPALFKVQKYAGIVLQGFDFLDLAVDIESALNVTIKDNRITILNPAPLISHTNGAAIQARVWGGEWIEHNNENFVIENNLIMVRATSTQPMTGVRLDSVNNSTITGNIFAPYSDALAGSVVTVLGDSTGLTMKANRYNGSKFTQAVYNLINIETSKIF